MKLLLGLMVLVFLASITTARMVIDLTHTLDKNSPKYPIKNLLGLGSSNINYFKSKSLFQNYLNGTTIWVAVRSVEFYEHIGTHIDAPSHFGRGHIAAHQIPVERLIGPGVVIDVKNKVKTNSRYAVTVKDIQDHEKKHGKIQPNSIVFMNSGWDKYFTDPVKTFGSKNLTHSSTFNFPGFSGDACKMLYKDRQVYVIGVDTPSTDPAGTVNHDCHAYLQPKDVILIENAANLDDIPERNTTIVVGAPKFRDSTGGPTRLLAFVDDEVKCSSGHRVSAQIWWLSVIVGYLCFRVIGVWR